ncbi:MAG TPA: hypothetical protein VF247_05445, partial [Candidatus Krumholzibacteria bacterium]
MKKFPDTRDLFIVAAGVIAAAIHIHSFHPFYCDDALISLRYAQRLLDGHGLTWTDGPRVEGYSNLLWILACAALGRLGVDLITASRVLGGLGVAGVFGALAYYRASRHTESIVPFAAAVAVIGLAAPSAAWALAGLETSWVAAFLAWGFVLLLLSARDAPAGKRYAMAGLCFGLLCLTRPDGPLFVAIVVAWLAVVPGIEGRRAKLAGFLFWPVALLAGQLAFRLVYYGGWLPNVWYVKISPSLRHFASGAGYVARGMLALMPASLLAIGGLVVVIRRDPVRRASAALLLAAIVVWLAYVAFIGGDIFLGRRHMVPFVVMAALGMIVGLEWLVTSRDVRSQKWALAAVTAVAWFLAGQMADPSNHKVRKDLWVW